MDRVAFEILGRPIYWYGIFFGLGFLAASFHFNWLARRRGRGADFAADLVLWIMLGTVIGARTAYVLANWPEVTADGWTGVFNVRKGGMVFYGGLIGASLLVVLFARRRGIPLLEMGDFAIGGVPLGHALGRIGCLVNGCCYGSETTSSCSVLVDGVHRHPTPLYEAVANLAVYLLLRSYTLRNPPRGRVLALYLLTYPVARFALEFLRGDDRITFAGLHLAQGVSLALFATGLVLWIRTRRNPPPAPADAPSSRR